MDNVKKRIIISMCAIVILILTLFGITYAYFMAKIVGNTNDKSISITAGYLELTYGDGIKTITVNNLIPGKTIESKTFTVENTGTGLVENYDVYLENVINELEYYEDLIYVLECTTDNGECSGSSGVFPKNDTVIVTNSISKDVIHKYKLTLNYKETHGNQSDDMNKKVSAKVNIKDDVSNFKTFKIYGNSVQNGIPSPTNPVEVLSLGKKSENIISINDYELNGNVLDKIIFEGNLSLPAVLTWDIDYTSKNKAALFSYIVDGTIKYVSADGSNLLITGTTLTQIKLLNWPQDVGNVTNIQLVKGDVSKDFKPYGKYDIPIVIKDSKDSSTKIVSIYLDEPLRKVGNYADYIDLENRKVVRKVARGIIDETFDFGKFVGVSDYSAFYLQNDNLISKKNHKNTNVDLLSNVFVNHACGGGNVNDSWSNSYQICGSLADTYTRIDFTLPNTITDVDTAKTWLKDNYIEYYYPIDKPFEEPIDVIDFNIDENSSISVCDENNVCASNIEVEFD